MDLVRLQIRVAAAVRESEGGVKEEEEKYVCRKRVGGRMKREEKRK